MSTWPYLRCESHVERLRKAIQDEGPHPPHHRRKLEQLRREWPTLYNAIMGLINERPATGRNP